MLHTSHIPIQNVMIYTEHYTSTYIRTWERILNKIVKLLKSCQ